MSPCNIKPGSCFTGVPWNCVSKPNHATELLSVLEEMTLLLQDSAPLLCFSCPFGLKCSGAGTPGFCICAGCGARQTPPFQSHLLLSSGCCHSNARQDGHGQRSRRAKIVRKSYGGPTHLNTRNLHVHYIFNLLLVSWSGANFNLMKIKC